jgi:hypothetical protein
MQNICNASFCVSLAAFLKKNEAVSLLNLGTVSGGRYIA